jgi:hypothetical protein
MTRRSKREIERAVEDLADPVDREQPPKMGSGVVFVDGDGYVTPDGDPVPTDDEGDPVPPDVPTGSPAIILDGRYDPRPVERGEFDA